jgi:hypothetical protein
MPAKRVARWVRGTYTLGFAAGWEVSGIIHDEVPGVWDLELQRQPWSGHLGGHSGSIRSQHQHPVKWSATGSDSSGAGAYRQDGVYEQIIAAEGGMKGVRREA